MLFFFSPFRKTAPPPPKGTPTLYLAVNKPSEREGQRRERGPGCLSSSSPKKHISSEQTEENKQRGAPKMRKRGKAKGPGEQGRRSLRRLPESGGARGPARAGGCDWPASEQETIGTAEVGRAQRGSRGVKQRVNAKLAGKSGGKTARREGSLSADKSGSIPLLASRASFLCGTRPCHTKVRNVCMSR